jgi:hypothetical protein
VVLLAGVARPARPPIRSLRLRERIEAVANMGNSPRHIGQHHLLKPVGLRIDKHEYLEWERLELEPLQPSATRACLWEFVELENKGPADVPAFVERWGVLDWGEDAVYLVTEAKGGRSIWDWYHHAATTSTWLRLLALAQADEPADADTLWPLADDVSIDLGHMASELVPIEVKWLTTLGEPFSVEDFTGSAERYNQRRQDAWTTRWQEQLAGGGWRALQRWLIAKHLAGRIEAHYFTLSPRWDDQGRHIMYTAYGVLEIVGAHMAAIFSAPTPEVYLCSVCERPYEWIVSGGRRPREGARRFCSSDCRETARRETNRAAWHRHKRRWRPSTSTWVDTN